MDASGVNTGAKAAISTLKESISIGNEGGKVVSDLQSDMHRTILQQQRMREAERHKHEQLGSEQEQKAYTQFINKSKQGKATEELKAHIIKVHGTKQWDEFLKIKAEVEAQDKLDEKLIHTDEQKMKDLVWWCFAAGAILAYFIVV